MLGKDENMSNFEEVHITNIYKRHQKYNVIQLKIM